MVKSLGFWWKVETGRWELSLPLGTGTRSDLADIRIALLVARDRYFGAKLLWARTVEDGRTVKTVQHL